MSITRNIRVVLVVAIISLLDIASAVLRLPLQHNFRQSETANIQSRSPPTVQVPFHETNSKVDGEVPRQPLQDVALVLAGFNLSIGEPPQSVPVALSIETAQTMVQSASCNVTLCEHHQGFNSTKSDTFEKTCEKSKSVFGLVKWSGHMAYDTLRIGSVDLPQQRFLYADRIDEISFLEWYHEYDGVLGLSPQSDTWTALTASGTLDQKIISIKLPPSPFDIWDTPPRRTGGELTLGGINPDYVDWPSIDLPVLHDSHDWWATSISSFASEDLEGDREDLPIPSTAMFQSASPFLQVPDSWFRLLTDQVMPDAFGNFMMQPVFDCKLRDSLATITMGVGSKGSEYNITLSAYEYSFEVTDKKDGSKVCILAVWPSSDDDTVGLGWAFLQMFVTILDNEEDRIRLIPKGPEA